MQKFFLMGAVLFGMSAALHAQTAPAAPAQPIPFNHKLHMQQAKMSCNDCHAPRGNGATVSMPQPPKCMSCHNTVATDNPDIKRLAEAAKNEDPIPWVRVYRVPSFVTFSHKTHAGSTCEECHGPVAERVAIAPEKEMHMGNCIACHQSKGAPATCDTCHAIMSKNGRSPFDADTTLLAKLHGQPVVRGGENAASPTPIWHAGPQMALASFLHAPLL